MAKCKYYANGVCTNTASIDYADLCPLPIVGAVFGDGICRYEETDAERRGANKVVARIEPAAAADVAEALSDFWISVDDSLPELRTEVLGYTLYRSKYGDYDHIVPVKILENGMWKLPTDSLVDTVTHWMPLPRPPKMDGTHPVFESEEVNDA